jgi:hypothetical protein
VIRLGKEQLERENKRGVADHRNFFDNIFLSTASEASEKRMELELATNEAVYAGADGHRGSVCEVLEAAEEASRLEEVECKLQEAGEQLAEVQQQQTDLLTLQRERMQAELEIEETSEAKEEREEESGDQQRRSATGRRARQKRTSTGYLFGKTNSAGYLLDKNAGSESKDLTRARRGIREYDSKSR